MAKLKATVIFQYEATAADELTLHPNDVVTNVKNIEPGWCEGILNGKTGVFPDNFVKIEEDTSVAAKPTPAITIKNEPKRLVKATHSYDTILHDELSFTSGDIVEVLDDVEPGWAKGRLNGKEGLFPTNFVEPYTKTEATDETMKKNPKAEEVPDQTPSQKNINAGNENITVDGPILPNAAPFSVDGDGLDMKKVSGDKIQEAVKENVEATSSVSKEPLPPVERCRATFDYPASTGDELSLKIGDIIVIINKNCKDPGWWEGEITGNDGRKRRGFFPDNFVELLPVAEGEKKKTSEEKEEKPAENKPENEKIDQSITEEKPETPPDQASTSDGNTQVTSQESSDNTAEMIGSTAEEKQLVHPKRVTGPKNRRKPDNAKRRERANETAKANDVVEETPDAEPEEVEAEPAPQVPPKRGPVRGIQVMPALSGGNESGEKPSWMVQLKKKASQKKIDSTASASNKAEEPEKPAWMSNLQKLKSGEKDGSLLPESKLNPVSSNHTKQQPPKPAQPAQTPKQAPARPPISIKAATEASSPELKRNVKADHVNQVLPTERPSVDAVKPVVTAKPKLPPPPKNKSVYSGKKPPPSSIDELKEELKALKEQFASFQLANTKEMARLSKELDDERTHRQALQEDMAKLLKRDR